MSFQPEILVMEDVQKWAIQAAALTHELRQRTVEERGVDLVLMGSHGGTVVRQVLIGSSLDYMLRESKVPLFICR